MKFFLDNCLSYRFADMLNALEPGTATSLRQEYAENLKDPIWLADLGKNGWTLVSIDRRQLKKPEERDALKKSGAVAFYLAKGFDHQPFMDQAWRLLKVWPAIVDTAKRTRAGQVYLVKINGGIEVLQP